MVRLSDKAFGGSLVLGRVQAFTGWATLAWGTAGGFTLSPGLWLNTSPAGMDTGLGGMGGGAECLTTGVGTVVVIVVCASVTAVENGTPVGTEGGIETEGFLG